MFGNTDIFILSLSSGFIKRNYVFLSHAVSNLQEIEISGSNFAKIKNRPVIFYKKNNK